MNESVSVVINTKTSQRGLVVKRTAKTVKVCTFHPKIKGVHRFEFWKTANVKG